MWLFAILATIHVVRSLIEFYVQQAFTIHWRVWLNEKLLSQWLDKQAYFRNPSLDTTGHNPDTRKPPEITNSRTRQAREQGYQYVERTGGACHIKKQKQKKKTTT